jgi:hypothetical protein
MLDGQKLAAITQGTLGEQSNFRQAIKNYAIGFCAFNDVEYDFDRLSQLKVRR